MRPFVVLSLLACTLFSTPAFAAWDIFQSYVIIDAGSGNQFLAGGYNADAAATFGGSDLGTFAASDALTLNGGELKTYKNGSSNVCGGNVYYRVYASGATPGSFSSVALPYDSELANAGDQKWDETAAGIDLLAGLTAGGAYTLEVYWDLAGADSDPAGCGETKFDSNFGNNFTASFTFNVPGCTDANYAEYDANANADDGSCATLMAVTNENTSATYATIQAAIDAATAGDVLTLAATAFNPTGTVTVDKSLTINGAGSASTTIDVGGYNAWGIYITANDVTLSGVTIQGDAVANQQFALKAGTGNNTGGSTSICANLTYSDIVIQGTKRTAIDLNGVDGATLTDITATGATGGFGMSISSSANVTVTNLTTNGNAWGDVGIFPANTTYQWPSLEGPTGITFGGTIDLSSGAGSISVQDGSLQSGGTWTGTISNDAADGADVTVPAAFSHVVNATRDADGLVLHNVGPQAAIHALAPFLAANGFLGTTIDDLDNGDIEVVEGLSIQDAIDAASAGDVIEIADGSYAIATPILVNKAVTLQGQSEASTVLTCEAALGGANSIQVTAGATLKDFTLEANSNATFGIHVQPGTDGAALSGLTINNTGSNGIGLSGVTNATVSDIAGSGNVQYILGIAGSVGVSASDISGGNVGVYKGTGTYAQSATDIAFTGTFNLAGGFVIEQLAGADEITYAIDGSAADVQIPASFDRVFFANYTSVPLPPPYNEASLATLVEAGNLATAIGTAQALDAYGYGLEGAAVYNLTADQWEVSAGLAIGDAMDRAEAGDVIDVAAGTYEEDLAFDKGLTINGPNAGIAHDGSRSAEAILDGEHTLSAAAAVTLDGLQFLSNNSAQTSTIYATTAAGHAIQNNLFVSSIAGGNTGGTHDLGIYTSVLASGSMTIAGNSFSGDGSFTDGDRYSSAAWGRGIWLNGGGAAVTISGNAFTNCRTGMTLESYANDVCSVDGNDFTDCGTGLSMSNPATAAVTTITANRFQDVDTDLNLRNLTQAVTWDLATSDNLAIPGNSTFYSDLGYIPGNSAGDIDDPNGNLAFLSGNGADNLTFGADDNTVTGDYTGAGNDYIDGGDGTDRVNYSDNETDVTLTAGDGFVIMDSPNGGLDTLVNIEYLVLADATISLVGCTFPDACNYNEMALVDDGSCEFTTCAGCRDEDACNYDSDATLDGPIGTCTFPGLYEDCAGNCVNDANSNNICDELEAIGVEGCTDATATNYNPDATEDDGSCYTYTLAGCLIPSATNYDPTVNVQGEPISAYCIFPWNAAFMLPSTDCADPSACNYDAAASGYTECDYCLGCTDEGACNYDDTALYDNGSCTYTGCSGCTSDCSSNYDATAVIDDGTCDYANCGGCTDSEADNYNPAVSIDDGSCQHEGCTLPSACNFDPDANANDGSCSLDPAPVISAVDLVLSTTSLSAADGEVSVTVDSGTPVSLDLEGLNGTTDASFSYPGTYNGLAAGYYAATVTDGFGCVSNSLNVVVSYDLCCDCGVSDIDTDGICDDTDNCTDRNAVNYNDAANGTCSFPGCTNPAAVNYDPDANTDDGSCIIYGCTDPAYLQYDAAANIDDGSCSTLIVEGCMDPTADNYNAAANTDDGSCIYYGCTDPAYMQYDASANTDDGSCSTLIVEGCTDSAADNYDPSANVDDGSCLYYGCTDPAYMEYDATANADDGSCSTLIVEGCTDPAADNYDAAANTDDGSCIITGCTNSAADNYNAAANTDDGSCTISGCMDPAFEEYNPDANTDDGSCSTPAYCSPVDMDGLTYEVVEIDEQCWFSFNLRTTVYADGTPIPYVGWEPSGPMPESVLNADTPGDQEWANDTEGGHCINLHQGVPSDGNWDCQNMPDNTPQFCCQMCAFGALYNHHAVMNASGLCPTGWHVPTDDDWTQLTDYVASQGFAGNEGQALKGSESAHWTNNTGPTAGTDDFGLALTGMKSRSPNGQFVGSGATLGTYWTSTIVSTAGPFGGFASTRKLATNSTEIGTFSQPITSGHYVRCIKDAQD